MTCVNKIKFLFAMRSDEIPRKLKIWETQVFDGLKSGVKNYVEMHRFK